MSNDTAKTITTNIVPVQGTFEPLPPYECINLIGPAGTPFYAPTNPNLDGVSITNSTINSTTIGATTPSTAAFTTATMTNQPIGNLDLCNKTYVDAAIVGISWKQPVRAATTANITLSGAQTIDTVPVVAGDRVLVKDQGTQANNGIYIVGTPWTRSPDADLWDELVSAMVFVESGGQAGLAFYCPVQPGGTLGVTAITWSNFSVAGTYFAGTGLSLAANTFSITNTGVSAATYGSASTVPAIAVNAQGQITSATNTNIAIAGSAITSGTIDSARISGSYTGITAVGTLSGLTVSSTINGSISGNAATATSATTATTATNLAGGTTGSVPYQSAAGTTTFVGIGSTGQILTVSGGIPTWAAPAASGDVTGPASSTDNAIARFDSTTGKIIQNSAITVSDAGALQNVNEVNFDVTPTGVVGGAGSVSWNSDDNSQTLEIIGINNIPILVGEELYYRIKASSAITAGQVVMFTGTLGASGGLTAAPATGLTASTGAYILGIATESIALNGWGYITNFGEVRGINTTGAAVSETWANGDILYYNPAVTGGLTKTVPAAPNAKVQVAAVVHAASNGILFVRPTFEPRLNDLSDVFSPSPTDGDVIVWDNTDARWENRAQSTLTAGSANNLSGGATGSLPYQSGAGATTFLGIGSTGQVLKVAGGVPTWSSDASGLTIADDTTTNATRYLTFTDATTGNISTANVASTKLQFNPSTGVLSATGFNGAVTPSSVSDQVNTSTGYFGLPAGTTAQRPVSPANGYIRFNTSIGATEVYSAVYGWEILNTYTIVPGAPTIGTATAIGSTSATVTYTAPVSNGGSVITSYTAVASPGGQTGTVSQSGSGTITVTGLTTGTAYTFTVFATNLAGNSASSAASNSITTWSVPDAPTIGTATATGGTTATVAYTAPAYNGGTAITSYTAVSSPGNITGTLSQAGSGTITVTGLTSGVSYTFTVFATNSVGNSAASAASNSITTFTVPGTPTIGTATATSATTATVSYTAPGSDGGSVITSYTAVSTPGNITGTISQAGSGTITVSGLSGSTSYTFKVFATNAIGNSADSAASNSITTPAAPYSITYTVVAGGGSGGGYTGGGGGAGGLINSSFTATPGTTYTTTVGGGASAVSTQRAGFNGTDSSISGVITATGGGAGANGGGSGGTPGVATSGGSGGGGGSASGFTSGGSGTGGQGNSGGSSSGAAGNYPSAGGGGAGSSGSNSDPSFAFAGAGGSGATSSINGSTYAGGGGGGNYYAAGASGGSGGGGAGGQGSTSGSGTSGSANTGGGGGGNGTGTSGAGGSGIIILSIPTSSYSGTQSGGSVTTSGSNTIITYTSSGSYTA